MEIYLSGDSFADPTQFEFDAIFRKVKRINLSTTDLQFLADGFAVTVYVPALDERANQLLENVLKVDFSQNDVPIAIISTEDQKSTFLGQ